MNDRILIVTDSFPPLIGGATRAIQQLAIQLSQNGYRITVATAWQRDTPLFQYYDGIPVYRVRDLTSRIPGISTDPHRHTPPPFPDPEAVWRLRRLITTVRPNIVYSYGWLTYSCAAALTGSDIPLVLSSRDYGYICPKRTLVRHERELCSGPGLAKCLDCATDFYGIPKGVVSVLGVLGGRSLLGRKAQALQSCSAYVQHLMQSYLLPFFDKTQGNFPDVVIPDFRTTSGSRVGTDAIAALPQEPYILYVGALRRIKGIEILLEAYERLREPPPLVLIGTPAPDTPTRFPRGVIVLENIPHESVMAAWDNALFGVAPSLLAEPLGNVVHEALSRGRTVIGTKPGGHSDIIEDGVNGILVQCGNVGALHDAMQTLIDDSDLRNRLQAEAPRAASRFTASNVLPLYLSLFRRVKSPTTTGCAS